MGSVRGVRARSARISIIPLTSNGTSLSEVLEKQLTFISFSFLTLNITTVNISTRIQILNSRFVLQHRYYRLFAQLNTALGNASSVIKLHDAAPRLVHCQDLEIAVPGTYVYSLILLNSRKRNINTRIHIHTGTKREVRSLELPSSIRPCKSFPRSNVRERSHCTEATA
jgi:hypothetical protein